MVAELRSELRTFEPVTAMSAASAAATAAWAGAQPPQLGQDGQPQLQPPVDPTALQAWCAQVVGRLDEQATRINGVGIQLDQTIGHARKAMQDIVAGVSNELTGFQRVVHHDHGKLNSVVGQIQQKFADIEAVVQGLYEGLALETTAKVAAMDARATRAEQRAGFNGRAAHRS